MNIVVYEHEHFEILGALLQVLNDGRHRVHLMVPRAFGHDAGRLPPLPFQLHYLPDSPAAHAPAVEKLCRELSANLLVLCSVSFRHWQFAKACRAAQRSLLYVHDLRGLLAPARGGGLRGWVRHWGQRRLRGNVSAYAVLLEELKIFLQQNDPRNKPVYVIPGAFYEDTETRDREGEKMVLAIPGSIDSARRSYDDLAALAVLLQQKAATTAYEVRLLGSRTGHSPAWIDVFPGLIRYEAAGLRQAGFDDWLRGSELVWLPLAPAFQRAGQPAEEYGVTKSSGAFFDALRFGKPVLAPDGLPVPEILSSALLRYSDATYLYYLLEALRLNPVARRRLQEMGIEQAQRLRPGAVRARLRPLIGDGT